MKKSDRLDAFVQTLGADPRFGMDPCYQGYFACFNAGEYYEAHDVLEHLWLRQRDENHAFYKGLIQIAGAFVHLKLQYFFPKHHKHGRRLQPAARLFLRGVEHICPYGPRHLRLDTASLCRLCENLAAEIAASNYSRNPWNPARLPQLTLAEVRIEG